MTGKFSLDGTMIPRTVRRAFNERIEERVPTESETAVLGYRGCNHVVRLLNISSSGAMVIFPTMPHIGEEVTLQMLDKGQVKGQVRWVRDGRVGVGFTAALE